MRDYRDYLRDMHDSMTDVESFTEGMTFTEFSKDKKTIYAVVRCIEVIGEAAKKVPKSARDKYPAIPWKVMAAMRNKMIHEYFGVNVGTVWQTIQARLPALKQQLLALI